MAWAMRKLAPGLGSWITRQDLENRQCFGFKNSFRTIYITGRAAKLRIIATTAEDVQEMSTMLDRVQQLHGHKPL
eukprot:11837206-Karenia_brevis.AAC.1